MSWQEELQRQFDVMVTALITEDKLKKLCKIVLDDPRFWEAPASMGKHHNYPGGLAVHTCEVASFYAYIPKFDRQSFIVAAIWHDYMKVLEYRVEKTNEYGNPVFAHTEYYDTIHHVSGSYAAFVEAAHAVGVEEELIQKIGHAILAHHGRKEWGSPVEPKTQEAYILHAADMWSAHFGPGKEKNSWN